MKSSNSAKRRTRPSKPKAEATSKPFPLKSNGADNPAVNTRHWRTDVANAEHLMTFYGDSMRFCHLWKRWLVWDGKRWAEDYTGSALKNAKRVAEALLREATRDGKPLRWSFAARVANRTRLEAMLSLAAPEMPILPRQLDRNPWLFNCDNGTLDLRTGELHKHQREDYITKLCPSSYNPDADTKEWEQFLASVFVKPSIIAFVQKFFGYCLTGDVREQFLPIFWGDGANGKSTLLETLLHVFGPDYAMKAPADLLLVKKNETHPTERADLFGKRFVACVESGEGRTLNETFVKELTGGDTIRARRMYENNWEFQPTHKPILCTNHCPELRGSDHAIWRRLALVPFSVTFWDAEKGETGADELKQDKTLPIRLKESAEAILAWCVQGCLTWQREGMILPPEVVAATHRYRKDQDVVAQFIEDRCNTFEESRVRASDLYAAYHQWSIDRYEFPISQHKFGETVGRTFERYSNNGIWYRGIALSNQRQRVERQFSDAEIDATIAQMARTNPELLLKVLQGSADGTV